MPFNKEHVFKVGKCAVEFIKRAKYKKEELLVFTFVKDFLQWASLYIPYDLTFNWNIINRRKKETKYNQRH